MGEKQEGNQESALLAELVDSIRRSLLGLIFFYIFINDMKCNSICQWNKKNKQHNQLAKLRAK